MSRTLLVAGTASHVGKSTVAAGLCRHLARRGLDVATPFVDPDGERSGATLGAASGSVLGTYLHGLFENDSAREAFLRAAGSRPECGPDRRSPYDRAADLVDETVDLAGLDLPA